MAARIADNISAGELLVSYGHHSGDIGTAFVWGLGLCLGWFVGGLIISGVIAIVGGIWILSANWHTFPRWFTRTILILGILAVLALVLIFSLTDTP